MLAVDPAQRQVAACLEDLVFGGRHEADGVAAGHVEDFMSAHRNADRDPFGHGGFGRDAHGLFGTHLRGARERVATFALQRNDLREVIDRARGFEVFEGFDGADEERAVADRNHEVFGHAAERLEDFVDVALHPFVEEGVVDVVRIVGALVLHLGAAYVGAVVARARNDVRHGAVRLDHADFRGARAFGNEDFAADPRACGIGRDGVSGVAARILHARGDADRLHVGDQGRRAAVLEGERRHRVVHLEQDVVVKGNERRQAFAHGDVAPGVALEREKFTVAELTPGLAVDFGFVPLRGREVEFKEAAALAGGREGGDGRALSALRADKGEFAHSGISAMASISTRQPKWSSVVETTTRPGLCSPKNSA